MAGATLYQLADEFVELRRLIDERGGQLPEDLEKRLDENKAAIDHKVCNIQRLITALEDDIKAQHARVRDFQKAISSARSTIHWLRRYCAGEMQKANLLEVRDPGWGVYRLIENHTLVLGEDIPEEFQELGKPKVNRQALRECLELGLPCGDSQLYPVWIVKRYRTRTSSAGKGTSRSESRPTQG